MRGNVVILDSAKFPRKKYLGLEVNALTRGHQLLHYYSHLIHQVRNSIEKY